MNGQKKFPEKFVWGTATASYQIEGGVKEGGRGETIWDRYAHIPGNVYNNDHGDVACDYYHRYKEDIQLMKSMGMKAYRFSIAWSRILPDGVGRINEEGIQFYQNVIDELKAAGIEPYITLYHWDLPQKLQDRGGWANDDSPKWFLEYAKAVFSAYSKQVKYWITLNEPYCTAFLGNYEGRQAPGLRDFSTALKVSYNLYRGHGEVVRYFRENVKTGEIGITLNLMGRLPFSNSKEDVEAAKRADGYLNRWFIEPIMLGKYPEDMVKWYKEQGVIVPEVSSEDLELMSQKLDFLGLNYYNDFYVKKSNKWPLHFAIENPTGVQVTDRAWPITEDGLKNMLLRLKNEYGVERIFITENGASFLDIVEVDGQVHDSGRRDYLRRHLLKVHEAIEAGVNVEGYFEWSFCDNYEWGFGYSSRFGLVYIDFETQERIVKDSGKYYSEIIRSNSVK